MNLSYNNCAACICTIRYVIAVPRPSLAGNGLPFALQYRQRVVDV